MKTTLPRLITITALFCAIAGAPCRMHASGPPCTNTVQFPTDSGLGSLRDALLNATNGETITFCPSITGTIHLTGPELLVSKSVTILGPGANVLAVSGSGGLGMRVFHITPGNTVTIAGLTISNGVAPAPPGIALIAAGGGGVYNDQSSLTVSNCTLTGNTAPAGVGAAIANDAGTSGTSTVAVVNCTLNNNNANFSGGAIYNNGENGHAVLTLKTSTLSGNSAGNTGGAIENVGDGTSGIVTILNCTFHTNSAGMVPGAIHNDGGSALVTIGSTILDAGGLTPSPTPMMSLGYNLSSDAGAGYLMAHGDQINTPALLGPLQDNGGPTPTHAPLCGSPAIDRGTNFSGSATDQRGAPRTFDVIGIPNAVGGDGTDIGAVESPITRYTVTDTNDNGPGTLRQAILDANANPGLDLIDFDPSTYGNILVDNGELLITDCLILNGPGATNVTLNGGSAHRVFHVYRNNFVSIAGLTITNGGALGVTDVKSTGLPIGGGILNEDANLTVNNCVISLNHAEGGGGGIANAALIDSPILKVNNCTISGNTARAVYVGLVATGGGMMNYNQGGTSASVDIVNSTLSGNYADGTGGGIDNRVVLGGASGTTLTIHNCTFSDNYANAATIDPGHDISNIRFDRAMGPAILLFGSTIFNDSRDGTIANTNGTVTSLGYNLNSFSDLEGFLTNIMDQVGVDPMLGPLQLNGGQTPTHALLCGSAAIDKGTNFLGLAFDQRGPGFARTAGGATDVGAFERQAPCNQPPVALCTNVTVSAGSNCTATASIDGGSYDPDAGDTITLSQSPAAPYGLGTNIVTLTVTDSHGASNSCVGMVIVVDKTAPTINCPSNIVTTNDSGQCSAVVNYTVTATDNCGSVTNITEDFTSGSMFSTGTNTVHVTAMDNAGNTNTCSFTITVLDTEAPVVGCVAAPNPAGKVFESGKNASAGSNPNGYYQLRAKDNCDAESAILIYVYDTGSGFVAGPFHSGNIVRVQHGSTPSSAPGSAPIVAVLRLVQDGLVYAQDTSGNVTPGANRCLLPVSIK